MNWKLVVIGGLLFYVVMFVVGFATGPLIHNGVLEGPYKANPQFWRPELNQDPPDMGALMPRWIAIGLITSLVLAAVYGWVRPAFAGPGWKAGLKFGLVLAIVNACAMAGWSGVFNLPNEIWFWWAVEGFIYWPIGGMALGWVGDKLAGSPAPGAAPAAA
jgi:hypothetical protein